MVKVVVARMELRLLGSFPSKSPRGVRKPRPESLLRPPRPPMPPPMVSRIRRLRVKEYSRQSTQPQLASRAPTMHCVVELRLWLSWAMLHMRAELSGRVSRT